MEKPNPSLKFIVASLNGSAATQPGFRSSDYFIVDQCGIKNSLTTDSFGATWLATDTLGLSKSRNLAIQHCTADILVITDSDVVHLDQAKSLIIKEFQESNADIITFQIQTPEGSLFKQYAPKRARHNTRSLFRVNSIEIAFRLSSITKANILFDQRFGLGSEFPTGEEIIFLFDAMNAGLELRYSPTPISIHPKESSGSNLYGNANLAKAKGAMFGRIFRNTAVLYCLAFSIRHYKKSGFSFVKFLTLLIQGCYLFLRSSKKPSPYQ